MSQTQAPNSQTQPAPGMANPDRTEQLSRLFDGDLEASRMGLVVRATREQGSASGRQFDDYVLISDVLRGLTPRRSDQDLTTRIAQAIEKEPVYMGSARPGSHRERLVAGRQVFRMGAVAASVAAVGFVSVVMWQIVGSQTDAVVASSADRSNTSLAAPGAIGSAQTTAGGVAVVPVAAWQDPRTREMLDAHGSMVVRLRVAGER